MIHCEANTESPFWRLQKEVEAPLVAAGLLDEGFVDSWALNLYHDGSGRLSDTHIIPA